MFRIILPLLIIVNLSSAPYAQASSQSDSDIEEFSFTKTLKVEQSFDDIFPPLYSTSNLEGLRLNASQYVLKGDLEKAWKTRVKIAKHSEATLDDQIDLLLSITQLTSFHEKYKEVIEKTCNKLKKSSILNSQKFQESTIVFLLKITISKAELWLKTLEPTF